MTIDPATILYQIYGSVTDFAILTIDLDCKVTSWSVGATCIFGFSRDEMIGSSAEKTFTSEDVANKEPWKEMERAAQQGRAGDYRWHMRKDGSRFWADGVLTPIRDRKKALIGYLKILRDITERKMAQDEVHRLASVDLLTGLENRSAFDHSRAEMISISMRTGQILLLLLIDLDRFKEVNDTLGHHAGDALLREAAGRIREVSRESDVIARLGGDEFALLQFNPPSPASGGTLAGKLLLALETPFIIDGREVRISASIGIAVCPSDATTAESLMKRADLALYQAKGAGRNCYHYFTKELDETAHRRNSDQVELRRIERAHAFSLAYQPIVDCKSGKTTSMEALLRVPGPLLQSYPVDHVIELAKEAGLIPEIGAWVIREAFKQLRLWKSSGIHDVKMAVNTCAKELLKPQYIEDVHAALDEFELSPSDIEIELTERDAIELERNSNTILQTLHAKGFSLVLDDFGTGYSSLSYLRTLPVSTLKLDKSFLRGVPGEVDANAVARAVVGLAQDLRLAVTAEGIESTDQAAFLLGLNCTAFQGYLFSRALGADDALAWLTENSCGGQKISCDFNHLA